MGILKRIENFGIGTDIVSIGRFKKLSIVDNSSFFNRIFTKRELEYCFSDGNAAAHLAVRFAGKEAVVKALSNIFELIPNYKEIEILNNEAGVPLVKLNNKNLNKFQARISLSHCDDKAIAFAIVMRVNEGEKD